MSVLHAKKLIMWTNFPFWMSGPNQTGHCNRAYGRKLPPCFKTALGTRTVSLDNKADLDISPWKSHLQKPPSKLSDKSATIGFECYIWERWLLKGPPSGDRCKSTWSKMRGEVVRVFHWIVSMTVNEWPLELNAKWWKCAVSSVCTVRMEVHA